MRVYTGFRLEPEQVTLSPVLIIVARYDDESGAFLGMRHLKHIVKHSPTGLSWGYAGSGPADLSLSILADHLGDFPQSLDKHSMRFYQDFKRDFVSTWGDCWMINSKTIQEWAANNVANGATAPLPV